MAKDQQIQDVIEQLKKTIQFLGKLKKFKNKKQKSERDSLVKDLNETIDKYTLTIGDGSISGSKSMEYDDVGVVDHNAQQQPGSVVCDNQDGVYEVVTVKHSSGDDANTNLYEDFFSDNYDDVNVASPKGDYIDMYQGLWDCYPDGENELLFKRGEIIHILSKEYEDYGWWVAENRSEQIGLVPTSYVMKAYDM